MHKQRSVDREYPTNSMRKAENYREFFTEDQHNE